MPPQCEQSAAAAHSPARQPRRQNRESAPKLPPFQMVRPRGAGSLLLLAAAAAGCRGRHRPAPWPRLPLAGNTAVVPHTLVSGRRVPRAARASRAARSAGSAFARCSRDPSSRPCTFPSGSLGPRRLPRGPAPCRRARGRGTLGAAQGTMRAVRLSTGHAAHAPTPAGRGWRGRPRCRARGPASLLRSLSPESSCWPWANCVRAKKWSVTYESIQHSRDNSSGRDTGIPPLGQSKVFQSSTESCVPAYNEVRLRTVLVPR